MEPCSPSVAPTSFDIGAALDDGPWSGWQKLVVALVASAIVLDGFDNQILGFAVPVLLREWGTSREALAPVFALGFVGMVIGTFIGGTLGDRIGRRPALILSVLVFGIATGLSATAGGAGSLGLYRAIAGFGLGGAMPNAATLLAEYAPRRKRSLAVTLGIVCIPLGGVGGGLIAAYILPAFGWRALFVVGGILPMIVVLALACWLPESPRFLVTRPARRADLVRLLARLGHAIGIHDILVDPSSDVAERASLRTLFASDFRRDTIALWIAFIACLLTTYIVFSWAPTLLTQSGFALSIASIAVATFNIGGVFGAILAAILMPACGSRPVMLASAIGGVIVAAALAVTPPATGRTLLIALLAIEGGFINAAQTSLYALAAQIYPTRLRSTGVGAAAGFGRIGAIISSFVGAAILAGGWFSFFSALAIGMVVTGAAIAAIARHTQSDRAHWKAGPTFR